MENTLKGRTGFSSGCPLCFALGTSLGKARPSLKQMGGILQAQLTCQLNIGDSLLAMKERFAFDILCPAVNTVILLLLQITDSKK